MSNGPRNGKKARDKEKAINAAKEGLSVKEILKLHYERPEFTGELRRYLLEKRPTDPRSLGSRLIYNDPFISEKKVKEKLHEMLPNRWDDVERFQHAPAKSEAKIAHEVIHALGHKAAQDELSAELKIPKPLVYVKAPVLRRTKEYEFRKFAEQASFGVGATGGERDCLDHAHSFSKAQTGGQSRLGFMLRADLNRLMEKSASIKTDGEEVYFCVNVDDVHDDDYKQLNGTKLNLEPRAKVAIIEELKSVNLVLDNTDRLLIKQS
jgi:hypothetical protein